MRTESLKFCQPRKICQNTRFSLNKLELELSHNTISEFVLAILPSRSADFRHGVYQAQEH